METKKCPYCAEDIKLEAIVCRYCGRDLPATTLTQSEEISPQSYKQKNPWITVVLNLFPLIMGLGYIYIGKIPRFIVVFGLQLCTLPFMVWAGLGDLNSYLLALIWIFTLFDGYSQTQKVNLLPHNSE